MAFSTPSWQAMPQTTLTNAVSGFRHHATLCLSLRHKVSLTRCALFLSWAIMGNHGRFLTTDYNVWFLDLGRSSRGERSKPGRDQGVSLDEPYSKDIVRARLKGLAPNDKLFPITSSQCRQWWGRAADAFLGKDRQQCSPHAARHTGASRDLATGCRSSRAGAAPRALEDSVICAAIR